MLSTEEKHDAFDIFMEGCGAKDTIVDRDLFKVSFYAKDSETAKRAVAALSRLLTSNS